MAIDDLNKNTRLSSSEFKPLILDDEEDILTQGIDKNVADQKIGPQYVDVDKPKFVQPERRSYFVAGNVNNNEINTTAQKPNEIEYEADVVDDEKKKDNYFGLSKLATNKKDIVKNALKYVVQAPNLIQNAANTIGMFTGKSGEDVVLEGVRSFAGSTVDFASAMTRFFGQNYMYLKGYKDEQLDKIANLGSTLTGGEDFSDDIKQKYTDFYNRIDRQTQEFKDKTERFLQYTGIGKTDKDGFIYDLVGGVASLMYAIGITAITKSPAAAAEFFGMYQYQSLYEEGIEKGFSPLKARTIGVVGGAAEGALEMVGLHVLLETLVARKSFMKLLKAAATEFVQEASQQGAEELLAKFSGMREEGLLNILQNVGYAGLIGALIGGGSATVSNIFYKQISDSATRELINNGMQSDYAKQMVNNMLNFSVSPQVADELNSILKDEQSPVTYKNADPRETYKEFGDTVKKALDPAQKRGVELELIQANKKLTQELANVLLNSGKAQNGDDAYRRAEQVTAMYDMLAREAYNQEGIRPEDYYKRFHVNAQSGNIEIDERNVDDNNISLDDSFNPIDFDETERAKYEAEIEGYEDWLADEQKRSGIKNNFETQKNILADIGIGKIRKPQKNDTRYAEYQGLSARIKNAFFTDVETAMTWDEAEQILQQKQGDSADIFEYFRDIDLSVPVGQDTYLQKDIFNRVLAKEKEDIKQKAIADGTFLKAPNGKDSNLPEQLWLTVRTKAFKNWFGDWENSPETASKVVDENGEPKVCYHGTPLSREQITKNRGWYTDENGEEQLFHKFNRLNQDQEDNPRGSITSFDRQYWIDLFSGSDKSTLLHEGSHGWLSEVLYFANGKNPSPKILAIKKQLDNWLGEPEDNGRYSVRQQELFAGASEVYFMEGKAPTPKLKTVFERFKKWLTDIYDAIKNDLPKINDDVRELFDTILSRSYDVPDSNIYAGKEKAIKEVIKNINEGRASEVDGITIDDVYNLLNVAYTRKPSKPSKNLKQLLNDKNIYDFNELNKAGADTVLAILKDGGYIKEDATAEAAVELARQALDGKPIYRLADQWRVAGDVDFTRNLRVLEKVIEFSQIDSVLEKILTLQEEGYRNVEQGDVEQVKSEYRRLMDNEDVKEAKKIVEDIINRLHKKRFIDRAAQKQMINDLKYSATIEEIRENVLNVIEDLQDEVKAIKEQLKNPRKPIVRKDKTIPPGKNATEEEKNNYKKYMKRQINRLLKQVLPSKRGNNKVSKFGNTEIQHFFEELVRINKLTKEEAEKEFLGKQAKLPELIKNDEKGEGFKNTEKIITMFYGYKSKIITQSSTEFLKQLYDALQKINITGRNEKQINDYLTNEKLKQDTKELLSAIDKNKSKNTISKGFKWLYNFSVGNWYSFVNSVAGQEQAEKYALETLEARVMTKAKEVCDRIRTRSCKVLGVKNDWAYTKKINEYSKEKYTFIENYINIDGVETKIKRTLNKMQLICCYIWSKNSKLKDRIIRAYGNEQFNEMMAKLNKQDIAWGNIIQEETASLYDDVNKVYVDLYGIDLGQEENYFPSLTERVENSSDIDLLKDFIINCSNPGFIKGRTESNFIRMRFTNPITIAENHIMKACKFSVMQKKLTEIYRIFKHSDIKTKLNEIYGENNPLGTLYGYMNKLLDNIKFENFERQMDFVNKALSFLANNYVLTRIALKPSIVIKQLLSFTNYMEDVDSALWIKHFGKMIAKPQKFKQIVSFMCEHSPYLKARYESGAINEALEKTLEGQPNAVLKLRSLKGFLSVATRLGDMGAIIFGGYPMIQAQLEKGVSIEKAFENFEKATLRSQQANFSSTLSNWQHTFKNNPLLRAFFAFGNTPAQYSRKLVDIMYKMAHGDEKFIKGKGAKTLLLYGLEQSFLYNAFTSLAILSGWFGDDWDDFKDDIWLSLLQVSNFLGFPFLGQLYQTIVNVGVTGEFLPEKRMPILAEYTDFAKALKKYNDEGWGELETEDWIKLIDKVSSVTAGVPIENLYNTWISSFGDIINGDYGKGLVKLYGATESRANKIFD